MTEKDYRAYADSLKGKKSKDIAIDEGVSQATISRRIARAADAINLTELDQYVQNKFQEMTDDALTGLHNHLKETLPNPRVLGDFLDGNRYYKRTMEFTGKMTVEQINAMRLENQKKGLARYGVKIKQ